jgi:hypothetical protein
MAGGSGEPVANLRSGACLAIGETTQEIDHAELTSVAAGAARDGRRASSELPSRASGGRDLVRDP